MENNTIIAKVEVQTVKELGSHHNAFVEIRALFNDFEDNDSSNWLENAEVIFEVNQRPDVFDLDEQVLGASVKLVTTKPYGPDHSSIGNALTGQLNCGECGFDAFEISRPVEITFFRYLISVPEEFEFSSAFGNSFVELSYTAKDALTSSSNLLSPFPSRLQFTKR